MSGPATASPMSDEDVTVSWLAGVLGKPGELESMTRTSIGTGQVGESVRYRLTWKPGVSGPGSVVGKFPSLDVQSRATAEATGSYVREVGFYRDLQSTVGISTPRVHHLDENVAANEFILVMEDLAPATQGDQLVGCGIEHAQRAIDELVLLHTPHWDSDLADRAPWAAPRGDDEIANMNGLIATLVPMFLERYADRLDPLTVQMATWIGSNYEGIHASYRTPYTLIHGDYRLDNMLFAGASDESGESVTIVDWQTAGMGRGPADAAYFVGAGLVDEIRADLEPDLMDRYIEGLETALPEHATTSEDLEHDYRLGASSGLLMAVVASQIVGRTDRGDDMFTVMADRHSSQMRELGTADLVVG